MRALKALATLAGQKVRWAWLSGGENESPALDDGEDKKARSRMSGGPMPEWAGGRSRRPVFVRQWWSVGRIAPLVAVVLLLVWVVLPPGLPSAPLTGKARVIDGDTLDVARRRVRLAGMDAPERSQLCTGPSGTETPCGETARDTLRRFVGNGPLTCLPIEMDTYGRVVATCAASDADLGEVMVAAGQAVASGRYDQQEAEARLARRGIWEGTFDRPSEWRRARQVDDSEGAPDWPVVSFVKWVANVFFH
jgi:endonuclease YncB( thermonuclease family)